VPPDTDAYPRPKWDQSERDKFVADLINQLLALERRTNPKDGARSAKWKDFSAANALLIASNLVNALAGWALDHQAGLALKDLKFVPLSTAKPPEHSDNSNVRPTDDDHRYEWYGRNWVGRDGGPIDPIVARKWLKNLVGALPGIFNPELQRIVLWALDACDYGEIQPMLRATKTGRKVNWTILRLQMRAITLVKQRETRGMKKFKALQEVAGAFGVSVDTIRTWERRLRTEFGHSEFAYALWPATLVVNESEALRSAASLELQEIARQYRVARRRK
jgi:hypothetical protein